MKTKLYIMLIFLLLTVACKRTETKCSDGCYEYDDVTGHGTLFFNNGKKGIHYHENDNERIYYDSGRRAWFVWYVKQKQEHYLTIDGRRDYIDRQTTPTA